MTQNNNYFTDPLLEVRTSLLTTTNTTGGDTRTGIGGNEINKKIQREIIDSFSRTTDFAPMVRRVDHDQLAWIWNIRTGLSSDDNQGFGEKILGKIKFYTEGGIGTIEPSLKQQLFQAGIGLRSDYELSGLFIAGSTSYYNALEDEARAALDALNLAEERAFICGSDTSAYGFTSAYIGLLQLMLETTVLGDTSSVYGLTRAAGNEAFLGVRTVSTSATASNPLDLKNLDAAITTSNKQGAKSHRRIFLVSEDRGDEIDQLLEPRQRFSGGKAGNLEIEGGLSVSTYRRVPVIRSRYMDKNGVTSTSAGSHTKTATDRAMYLLDMDNIMFFSIANVDKVHVPILGADTSIRSDVRGGYYKTYGSFLMKRFDTQVIIFNLDAPV